MGLLHSSTVQASGYPSRTDKDVVAGGGLGVRPKHLVAGGGLGVRPKQKGDGRGQGWTETWTCADFVARRRRELKVGF